MCYPTRRKLPCESSSEKWCDCRQRGMEKRKARESNPHFPKENRVSTAARRTVSGCLPNSVETMGIEPIQDACKALSPNLGTCVPQQSEQRGKGKLRLLLALH